MATRTGQTPPAAPAASSPTFSISRRGVGTSTFATSRGVSVDSNAITRKADAREGVAPKFLAIIASIIDETPTSVARSIPRTPPIRHLAKNIS